MAKKQGKRYSSDFKFEVVIQALTSEAGDAEVARRHGVHPVTLSNWKAHFLEHGSEVFARKQKQGKQSKKIAQLEQMLDRKEVELALAKNFLKKKLTRSEQIALTRTWKGSHGLNRCLRVVGLANNSWYAHLNLVHHALKDAVEKKL